MSENVHALLGAMVLTMTVLLICLGLVNAVIFFSDMKDTLDRIEKRLKEEKTQ